MQTHCATCGGEIPPQQGRQRPRKYCTSCSPPRGRKNPRVIELPDPDTRDAPPGLVSSYRDQLERAGALGTREGAHVMHLAELLANGTHTASGAASLSRELRTTMDAALKDASGEGDRLDDLSERRKTKASGA